VFIKLIQYYIGTEDYDMDALQAIKERSMYRGTFQKRNVEKATILKLIEAARWAPSGHNSQPWEFIVIDDSTIIHELVALSTDIYIENQKTRMDLKEQMPIWWGWFRWTDEELETKGDGMYLHQMSRAVWEDMRKTESMEELRMKYMEVVSPEMSASRISESPCVILTLLDKTREIPNSSQDTMALIGIGAVLQNLRITVYSLGMAAHEVSLLYDLPKTREKIMERLGIPSHFTIVSAMRIGYPGEPSTGSSTHVRRPVEKLIHWNHF
jgi:nitroreductase